LADPKQTLVGDPWDAPDPALALALQQVQWYGRHRKRSRVVYQVNEILVLLTSASTTVAWVPQLIGLLVHVLG
jgi:hypothetical protein